MSKPAGYGTIEEAKPDTAVAIPQSRSRRSSESSDGHKEKHFSGAEILRDVVIGLSDGLTVPFALAAGLSAIGNNRLVVLAGLAEIAAGGISMGLGGFLAGRTELEHYNAERHREEEEIIRVPECEEEEIREIFEPFGLVGEPVQTIIDHLKKDKTKWVDFMMKFELGLEEPDSNRSWQSALTIGTSYIAGGIVPLVPYMLTSDPMVGLYASVGTTIAALGIFGAVKGSFMKMKPLRSGLEMMLTGTLAAGAAYGMATLVNQFESIGGGVAGPAGPHPKPPHMF
eukprot:tig00021179_g19237.t1